MGISLASKLGENLIINPLFDFFQRGNDTGAITSGSGNTYGPDRFMLQVNGAGNYDLVNSAIVTPPTLPDGMRFSNQVLRVQSRVATTPANNQYTKLEQRIEGHNIRKIQGKNLFFKNWVYSERAGTYTFFMTNENEDVFFLHEIVLAAGVWTEVKIRIPPFPYQTSTFKTDNTSGLKVGIVLTGGSDFYSSTFDSWETTSTLKVSENQTEFGSVLSENFWTGQWQLHEGIDEIPFDELMRDYSTENELCQRYFFRWSSRIVGYTNGNAAVETAICFPTEMRVVPGFTQVGSWTTFPSSAALFFSPAPGDAGRKGGGFGMNYPGGTNINSANPNTADSYVMFDAEL